MHASKWTSALLPVVVMGTWSTVAHADEVVVAPAPAAPAPVETRSETISEKGGPSRDLLVSGVLTLGLTYGAGAVVAATSGLDADHRMFVPIAGPWMALFDRGPCGGDAGRSCDAETTYKVLIVADGIGQALGSLMIIDAFLNPETRTVSRSTTGAEKPRVRLAPTTMGAGGYGMLAVGSF